MWFIPNSEDDTAACGILARLSGPSCRGCVFSGSLHPLCMSSDGKLGCGVPSGAVETRFGAV